MPKQTQPLNVPDFSKPPENETFWDKGRRLYPGFKQCVRIDFAEELKTSNGSMATTYQCGDSDNWRVVLDMGPHSDTSAFVGYVTRIMVKGSIAYLGVNADKTAEPTRWLAYSAGWTVVYAPGEMPG